MELCERIQTLVFERSSPRAPPRNPEQPAVIDAYLGKEAVA